MLVSVSTAVLLTLCFDRYHIACNRSIRLPLELDKVNLKAFQICNTFIQFLLRDQSIIIYDFGKYVQVAQILIFHEVEICLVV